MDRIGMSLQDTDNLAARHTPEFEGIVTTARERAASIRGNCDGIDGTGMFPESTDYLSTGEIPKFEGFIATAREHCAPTWGKGDGPDIIRMSPEGTDLSPTRHTCIEHSRNVPKLEGVVPTSRQYPASIRDEFNAIRPANCFGMRLDLLKYPPVGVVGG